MARGHGRSCIAVLALAVAACSAEPGEGEEDLSGAVTLVPAIDYIAIQREQAARFATAPVYRSAIREELIRRPDDYRVSYRPIIDSYRGLEPEFRCPYSAEGIARAQADGWQLTRCDFGDAVFLKRLETPRRCQGTPAVPDHFATLRLNFEMDRLRRDSAERRREAGSIFAQILLARGNELTTPIARRFSIGDAEERIEYVERKLSGLAAHYFLDRAADTLVVLHEPDEPGGCSRNALGIVLGDGVKVSVDFPTQDYSLVQDELAEVLQYAEATTGPD
ncbi:MAG: hypothetical protein ABIT10_09205 [Alteraurantiacibacter sp.]